MMKSLFLAAFAILALAAAPVNAAPAIGAAAPDFTATDSNGKSHSLSDFKGKVVVLEWTNPGCPFVKKHYESGNMQALQQKYVEDGVVWLTVNSSAEGQQGHQTPEAANDYMKAQKSNPTARLLDPEGKVGKLYAAKVTPHMFVIDKDGMLAYDGAIDDNDSAKPEDAKTATNYVAAALDALAAGNKVETAKTRPYGCSVKYAD